MTLRLLPGDCLEILPALAFAGEAFDAVITDPPYHLTSTVERFGKPGSAPARSNGATGVYGRASAGFMGKQWDGGDIAFRPETWRAVYDVMKPGAHLVAFGGSRTWHRIAVAIEDAGFEIRDTLCWLYGTGFPKSLDVSKAIDKQRTEDRAPIRAVCRYLRAAMDSRGLKSSDLALTFDCHSRLIDHWAARDSDSQPNLPTWDQWLVLKITLGMQDDMDGEVWRLNGRKGTPGDAWESRPVTGAVDEWTDRTNYALTSRDGLRRDIPATPEAARWQGFGTSLKPSFEPIILARKPLDGTVAANVLRHGVGGLNIDGCRIETDPTVDDPRLGGAGSWKTSVPQSGDTVTLPRGVSGSHALGRWPANTVHDGSDEVLAAFAEYGESTSSAGKKQTPKKGTAAYGDFAGTDKVVGHNDPGTAARFFYSAKATKQDRAGSAHPTVKPIALMQWLVRLITPPGGHVLDPFAGSGSTLAAAHAEGMRATGIEREPEYQADIERRIAGLTCAPIVSAPDTTDVADFLAR